MPLIGKAGAQIADTWTHIADPEGPAGAWTILPLARLIAMLAAGEPPPDPVGVWLASADHSDAIAAALPRLALVAVEFPKFRDGRGFTIARALRERYGFAGEIRAFGHVLPDQYLALLQCGFTTVEAAAHIPVERWAEALIGTTDSPPKPRNVQLLNRLAPRNL
jgi:uncharacterized protein (DUF934 family)